jgi:hypothetical protein
MHVPINWRLKVVIYRKNCRAFSCLSCEFVNTTVLNISNVLLKPFVKLSTCNVVVRLKYLSDGIERLNLRCGVHCVAVI